MGRIEFAYAEETKLQLFDVIRKVLREFGRAEMPVVADLDFGHTSPQCFLPNGCRALVDGQARSVALIEAAVV